MAQLNKLINYVKYQYHKVKLIHLLITALIITLFATPYYIDYNNYISINDEYISISTPYQDNNPIQNMTCPHYKTVLFISSEMEQIDKRMLMREELFGITDNLIPCMKQDTTEILYKFFVRKSENIDEKLLYLYKTEQMEYYNDIVEVDVQQSDDWHQSLLEHAQSLQESCTTFDHLILIDIFTMINLEKVQNKILSSMDDTRKMVWGSFVSNRTENMAVIMGSSAIQPILNNLNLKLNYTSIISSLYFYNQNNPNEKILDDLIFINDPISILEWPNSIKGIDCIDCIFAIGHLYQDLEIRNIKNELNISTTLPCNARSDLKMYSKETTSKSRSNIAVLSSSFLYDDSCMVKAGLLSSKNKREYAEKYGYAFVPRSTEFIQQIYQKRRAVWGKIDAIEKVLPYYEWLLWIDMDAIFVNRSISIEKLLKDCEERAGGKKAFEKINLIIARPVGDKMINAGVFLVRNSDWARDFFRHGVQPRYDLSTGRNSLEQQAIRDSIKKPYWGPNVLYLDQDDHTINTFPNRYVRGDYIVHYAPVPGCPATKVLKGLLKIKVLEESPNAFISIPF